MMIAALAVSTRQMLSPLPLTGAVPRPPRTSSHEQCPSHLGDDDAFDAWITRIAVNRCKDLRRRENLARARLPALSRSEHGAPSDLALTELIDSLPTRDRTVLVLHYGHGYGLHEIAGLLEMSHTNVRTVIARTRHRLAERWLEGRPR